MDLKTSLNKSHGVPLPPPSSFASSSLVHAGEEPDPRWPSKDRWLKKPNPPPLVTTGQISISQKTSSDITPASNTKLCVPVLPLAPSTSQVEQQLEANVSIPVSVPATSEVVVTLGAWSKPLPVSSGTPSDTNWPTLLDSYKGKAKKKQGLRERIHKSSETVVLPMHKQDDRKEDDLRFPWAARMDPNSRNLYRATEPEYLEDGTPKVTIPPHVLLQGLENQKEYILGQFYRCSPPPGGLIFAVFNNLWGRKCRITIRKLGESNYLFHIPDEATRKWVLQRGLWHVDDCMMFVASWSPEATLAIPEIKTIPVWVTLKKIPNILYSIPGISHIASGLGAPMATHKPRLDPILMGEAKILVEVELSKAFPPKIAASDDTGFISMVDVEYAWLPTKCSRCGQLGHKVKRCLQPVTANDQADGNVIVIPVPVDALQSAAALEPQTAAAFEPQSAAPQPAADPAITTEVIPSPKLGLLVEASILDKVQDTPVTENVNITLAQSTVLPTNTAFDAIETPFPETVSLLSTPTHVVDTVQGKVSSHSAQREHTMRKSSSIKDFDSNRFASLSSSDNEDEHQISEDYCDPTDFLTPTGKRILRERPVKPSTKAKEMQLHFESAPRGNRGRGRGGCG